MPPISDTGMASHSQNTGMHAQRPHSNRIIHSHLLKLPHKYTQHSTCSALCMPNNYQKHLLPHACDGPYPFIAQYRRGAASRTCSRRRMHFFSIFLGLMSVPITLQTDCDYHLRFRSEDSAITIHGHLNIDTITGQPKNIHANETRLGNKMMRLDTMFTHATYDVLNFGDLTTNVCTRVGSWSNVRGFGASLKGRVNYY